MYTPLAPPVSVPIFGGEEDSAARDSCVGSKTARTGNEAPALTRLVIVDCLGNLHVHRTAPRSRRGKPGEVANFPLALFPRRSGGRPELFPGRFAWGASSPVCSVSFDRLRECAEESRSCALACFLLSLSALLSSFQQSGSSSRTSSASLLSALPSLSLSDGHRSP